MEQEYCRKCGTDLLPTKTIYQSVKYGIVRKYCCYSHYLIGMRATHNQDYIDHMKEIDKRSLS